jgi:hypothetical protein
LETYIISKFKPLANKKYYWTPDQSATHSEDERRLHSKLMMGRKQPKEGIQRSAKSRTNKYTLELYCEDELLEVFKNTTAVGITNWILENHKIIISPSSLWATISQRKGRQAKGYRLKEPAGESGLQSKTKILRSIKGNPVVTKDVNGNIRVFVSSAAAAEVLNINEGDLGSVRRNSYSQGGGYSARNLTEHEINENYHEWPAYYQVKIDKTEFYTFNLSSFCRSHNLVIGTVHKRLSMGTGYSITNGMKISGAVVHKHSSLELFDVEIIDDLPIPSPLPVAAKQSDVKGVFWIGSKRKWEIKILIGHKENNFGSTIDQDIAVSVAEYVLANLDEPKIIESGRNLLKELKSAAGEQTKDSQLNKHSGTGKDRLIRAAELGEELLKLSMPSGNKQRNEWLKENYEIDLRRAQRYMQIARGRQSHPAKFYDSDSISTFLKEII